MMPAVVRNCLATATKRIVMQMYCAGLLSLESVTMVFAFFDLRGV